MVIYTTPITPYHHLIVYIPCLLHQSDCCFPPRLRETCVGRNICQVNVFTNDKRLHARYHGNLIDIHDNNSIPLATANDLTI